MAGLLKAAIKKQMQTQLRKNTMKDGPNIVAIAALIGDHARAEVLTALMSGMALTATELAEIAGVSRQTISSHMAKLLEAGLVAVEAQGRHRYFRLANEDVAQLLESLMNVAFRSGALRLRSSPVNRRYARRGSVTTIWPVSWGYWCTTGCCRRVA
jgi:DNA-binding transcriptional ArsR family regulator